jgi:hypothetical protein
LETICGRLNAHFQMASHKNCRNPSKPPLGAAPPLVGCDANEQHLRIKVTQTFGRNQRVLWLLFYPTEFLPVL